MKQLESIHFIASDYSSSAIKILQKKLQLNENLLSIFTWDILTPCPELISSVDCTLCIFVLSALSPNNHKTAFENILSVMPSGSVILFRDYGDCDMTMFRHTRRLDTYLFQRTDNTLCFYFTLDYLHELCAACDLKIEEIKYATVNNVNRKKNLIMKRVFVHGVFRKK